MQPVMQPDFYLLLLLLIANGAPIISRQLLGQRWNTAVDCGIKLSDGYPVFGAAKTFRGIIAAALLTTISSSLLGFNWTIGLLIGLFAMIGDLISSFLKRRMGLSSGSMAMGLDQIPESFLPLLVCMWVIDLSIYEVIMISAAFVILNLLLSKLLYYFGIRQHPY